jgi:hypothetical protein
VCIDGTRKWKEEGYTREWPEPCRMSAEVEARVDAMWPELGIGAARPAEASLNGIHGGSAVARVLAAARELMARARP